MKTLIARIEDACANAFAACGYDKSFGAVSPSDRPDLSDFQCNGVLALAKSLRSNPIVIGEAVVAQLPSNALFTVEFVRPGFLNFSATDAALIDVANRAMADARCLAADSAAPKHFLLDYGGANLAKEMHVGHLRSCIIGQALNNILTFLGHQTTSDVHMGDWGLQIGQLIAIIEDERPDLLEETYKTALTLADLQDWYPRASARIKVDPAEMERARHATTQLQAGDTRYMRLWERIRAISIDGLQRDYDWLGVHFDQWYGESRYQQQLDGLVDRLVAAGAAGPSEGAIVVAFPDQEDLPPLILRNSNGGYGYGSTDLATIEDRVTQDKPDTILYVVDARQSLHFRQVFAAAEKCGLLGATRAEHIAFGTVKGVDGKPFKTRTGGVMRLQDLIQTATDACLDRLNTSDRIATDIRPAVATAIAAAAIKFGELVHDREKDYIFNIDQFLMFEGKTGPYLQYTCTRTRSLLAQAAQAGIVPGLVQQLGASGRNLVLCLDEFSDQLNRAADQRKPSHLANHAYKLADLINQFYEQNRILGSDQPADVTASRVGLLTAAVNQLALALGILGIAVPAAM